MHWRLALPTALLIGGAACSAGPAEVEAWFSEDDGFVRVHLTTEGKNTFTVAERSCEAPKGGSCRLEIPVTELQGGWNRLPVATKRKTGMDEPLTADVHLGAAAFPRDCSAAEVPGVSAADAAVELSCTFPPGYRGELWGEPLVGGRKRLATTRIVEASPFDPADTASLPTPDDPLLVVDVPLEVVNDSGGRLTRPVRVAVPAPFVQFEVTGWESVWFERALPLRLRAEAGAEIEIDGKRVFPPRAGESFTVERLLKAGENVIEVRATLPGRVPSIHTLRIEGRYPESPLYVDSPTEREFETEAETLTVRGRSHPKAEVFWGRVPVPLRSDGSFEVDVRLEEGRNDVEISAFLAETEYGVLTRKPATRTFLVDRRRPTTSRRLPTHAPPVEELEPLTIAEVAGKPWQTAGETVRFALLAEDIDLFPSETGCHASIQGVGCAREESRTAYIAFQRVQARTCVGERHPTFVELPFCPRLEEGTWVEVEGRVVGGFAGRGEGQQTIVQLRVAGDEVEPRPRILAGG